MSRKPRHFFSVVRWIYFQNSVPTSAERRLLEGDVSVKTDGEESSYCFGLWDVTLFSYRSALWLEGEDYRATRWVLEVRPRRVRQWIYDRTGL